ncbi:MAG: LOG family protein [Zetaproteobacteria bacterium]|nr:LOG family protein [Zetaproteobacteria bacterium]
MSITRKRVRKVLNRKIFQLNNIIADIDGLLTDMETRYYRVSIFGSARLQPETELYKEVYQLAYALAMRGVDVVTGGGPGLMDAANKGAKEGGEKSRSIGLAIDLPFEAAANAHLDVKRQHKRFSSRLDEFMRISHAVIVTPGGIGTLLELFYTWQLIQVGHIKPRPILLMGGKGMWRELMEWIHQWPLDMELMSQKDVDSIKICDNIHDAVATLEPFIQDFQEKSTQAADHEELT